MLHDEPRETNASAQSHTLTIFDLHLTLTLRDLQLMMFCAVAASRRRYETLSVCVSVCSC